MNVLVIGSGGREHALAWKLKQSPAVNRVFIAPGNAGTAQDAENIPIAETDFASLIRFAKDNHVELTVVGPEAPLAAGIVNVFRSEKLRIFGPTKEAAELESSKVFCKQLLRSANVPTADFQVFSDAESARRFLLDREDMPVVVKADGLAAGKGVIVCENREKALAAVEIIAEKKAFGSAGDRLVIEEKLHGEEASVLAITDGQTIVTLQPAQDHKPAYDGDIGPNTGGMGAYSPAPVVDDEMLHWIEANVLVPTIHAMKKARRPFQGVLYAGLMITPLGPRVLEYNVRFGDPECQPLMLRLKSDLLTVLDAAVSGCLDQIEPLEWDPRPAVCVVLASEGYPGEYKKGFPISGLEEAAKIPNVKVFHAGTAIRNDQIVTAGGRVLGVTALGDNIARAKYQAYAAVKCINWPGKWCRKDIADKAINRMKPSDP
ncbi:MAG: phosphoribosylamine--glycine ligase [Thermogutta sp.]